MRGTTKLTLLTELFVRTGPVFLIRLTRCANSVLGDIESGTRVSRSVSSSALSSFVKVSVRSIRVSHVVPHTKPTSGAFLRLGSGTGLCLVSASSARRYRIGKGPGARGISTTCANSVDSVGTIGNLVLGSGTSSTSCTDTILGRDGTSLTLSDSVGTSSTSGARCRHDLV